MENYTDFNARIIDGWAREGWEWSRPISREAYAKALKGEWDVLLTPTKPVPHGWLGELRGKRLLGLACGGAQQMPVFAALGAVCTVLDYSQAQTDAERMVAAREGYEMNVVRADMSKPLPFADESFDIIFHPVSNIFVKDVRAIWRECFRVLKPGGVLLSGLDNGFCFLFDDEKQDTIINTLPFDPLVNPEQMEQLRRGGSGVQFSHTMEEQLGGQLEAGFILTHLYEDTDAAGFLHDHNVPLYVATRAIKPE